MRYFFAALQGSYARILNVYPTIDVLLSFADKKIVEKFFQEFPQKKIFLDSGAFTAFTKGKTIDVAEYAEFVNNYSNHIEFHACLDVIGNWKETANNQERLEKMGLSPIPTFHYKSPINELVRLCREYEFVALGGLVPISKKRKQLTGWLDYCFSHIPKGKKIHGFGLSSPFFWQRYPFYSCDSTGWLSGPKFRSAINIESNERSLKNFKLRSGHHVDSSKVCIEEYIRERNKATDIWNARGIQFN